MKIDDIVKSRTPWLYPEVDDESQLAFLRERLHAVGYSWSGVEAVIGTSLVSFAEYPGYLWRCRREGSPLARMIMLWLLGERLPRAEIEAVLGAAGTDALLARRILRQEGDEIAAQVDIYPCEDALVFTDHAFGVVRFKKHVYELGSDSYAIARMTPRKRVGQVLDLCTGSGIHAIMASRHADRATGVDISDRALDFSRVNAALNGARAGTRYLQGNLYEAVPGETFDLIIANPPWIAAPTPDMELYRWGGETGEFITRRVVEGLPAHLNEGGTLSMFVIFPIIRGKIYLERFREWLPASGWGVAIAESPDISLESFIRLHLEAREDWGRYVRECADWMDAYARHDIERMGIGMAYVRRLPEGRPGWGVVKKMPMPPCQMAPHLERWLDGLETYLDPAWEPAWDTWVPTVSERIGRLWRDSRSGEGQAEFRSPWWGGPVPLTADEMTFLDMLEDGDTAATLADRWKTGPAARAEVRALLASLGAKEIL